MRIDPAVALTRRAVRDALRAALVAGVLTPGDLVLAAVSGGADSTALAAALAWTAPQVGLRAGAVTVDHRLQAGSADRAAAVVHTAERLGLSPVRSVSVDVGGAGGPEAAARRARHAAVDAVAADVGASAVAYAHTLDDQAETVLLGLARGSGARSLAGMRPVTERGGRWVLRPLLGIRRAGTEAACTALGLGVWADPHNADPAYARPRVRQDALPALEAALGPGIAEALARSAEQLRDDADALDEWAAMASGDLSATALARLPAAVRRRVLRAAAVGAGSPAGALTAAHLHTVDRLVTQWRGQGPVSLPGGLVAERRCDRLSFR